MSKSLVIVKYFFISFSIIGLIVTLFSAFLGSNEYNLQQKLIISAIFLVFFTVGPFIMYKMFSLLLKRGI